MFQEYFLDYYRARTNALQAHFLKAATDCDPAGIHDLRVEIKQLRAFFKLLKRIVPSFRAKKNLRQFRELFKAAADIRDVQVQQELTRNWTRTFGLDLSAYACTLKHKASWARKGFLKLAGTFDLAKPVAQNERKLIRAVQNLSEAEAAANTSRYIAALVAQMLEFGRDHTFRPNHLHQLRILTKEARYIFDLARLCFPALGCRAEFSEHLRSLHQALGKWHDTEIALGHLADFQAEWMEAAAAGETYPELTRLLQQEKSRLFATFEEHWQDFIVFRNETLY